jgi:hypothetical protein
VAVDGEALLVSEISNATMRGAVIKMRWNSARLSHHPGAFGEASKGMPTDVPSRTRGMKSNIFFYLFIHRYA